MKLTTDSPRSTHRSSGLLRARASRALVLTGLAALAAMAAVRPALAQQSATIRASAVVMPSFVEVVVASTDARLVQVRGVPGASVRTVAVAGRDPADGPTAPVERRVRVVVEYPAT